jgi:hypothetical protein
MMIRKININSHFISPKKPEPSRQPTGGNYKTISNVEMIIKLGRAIFGGSSFRNEANLSSSGCH